MSYVTIKRLEPRNPAPPEAVPPAQTADFLARANQEIERLRAQAQTEGYQHGAAQGRADAKAETKAALQAAVSALQEASRQLETPLAGLENNIAEMVTDLAFILARHIIGIELQSNTESIRALVAQLVQEAASERTHGQNMLVRLNPEDHVTIENLDHLENTKMMSDPSIARGGALVEITSLSDSVEKIEWDATIEARLAILRDGLALPGDGDAP